MAPQSSRPVSPTGCYSLMVPIAAVADEDETVASYWIPDEPLLLQMSSRVRQAGTQVNAADRLRDFLSRETLSATEAFAGAEVPSCDFAACRGIDAEHMVWVYAYAVWPDLAILITASGDADLMADHDNWVYHAMRSIRRNEQ